MRQGLLILVLICMVAAMLGAIWSHTRLKASPAERWSARGTLLLSTGTLIGILPGLLFPRSSWISITGSLVSMVFTVGSFVAMRHVRRRTREANAQ